MANTLCRHFAEGRLNEEELNDRLARVAAARKRLDLGPLLADLPRFDEAVAQTRRPRGRRWSGVVLCVVSVWLVGWSSTGVLAALVHPHVPWVLIAVVVAIAYFCRPRDRDRRRHGFNP